MSINSAMSRWHLEYGDQNSRWSATVARNCLVAATLLGYLKNTTPKLDEIPLDRGLLLIEAPEYSADGQQTQLLDTMPQFVSPTWTAVVTTISSARLAHNQHITITLADSQRRQYIQSATAFNITKQLR
jgi:hypothetical protein